MVLVHGFKWAFFLYKHVHMIYIYFGKWNIISISFMNRTWLRYPLSNLDLEKKYIKLYNYIFLLFPTVSRWRYVPRFVVKSVKSHDIRIIFSNGNSPRSPHYKCTWTSSKYISLFLNKPLNNLPRKLLPQLDSCQCIFSLRLELMCIYINKKFRNIRQNILNLLTT